MRLARHGLARDEALDPADWERDSRANRLEYDKEHPDGYSDFGGG